MNDNDTLPPEARAWLRDHPEEDAASLERAWQGAGEAEKSFVPDPDRIEAMEQRIAAATQTSAARDRPPVRRRRSQASRLRRYAPVALLVAVAAGLVLWLRPLEVQAPVGEKAVVTLPEGSAVELNSGSRLVYHRTLFGWSPFAEHTRRVRLDGEAFFTVVPTSEPFVVATFNSQVTVLGTRFNVRAWPDASTPSTNVVVEEGRVRVAAEEAAQELAVTVHSGQMTRVLAGSRPAEPVAATMQKALAWRTGGLSFSEAPLGAILAEVERRTGASISVASDSLRNVRLSLFVERVDGAEAILEMIARVHGLAYHRTEEGYVFTARARP